MVDDDGDDSDKKFPTCVEKQTGCDVDRSVLSILIHYILYSIH